MFINWAHHYVPKFAGIASILVNILFVYIVHNDRKVKLGNYRFLLLFFATYNMICTIGDVLVPMVSGERVLSEESPFFSASTITSTHSQSS